MDIKSMRCFLAVAETLNFSRAAESIYLSQPALSLRINAMEDELGAKLFLRTRQQVYLTAANVLALIWFFFLLFTGIMTIHQYTLGRMLVTTVITAAAMIAILFIGLLFFNLFSQLVSFAYSVYKEILLRT